MDANGLGMPVSCEYVIAAFFAYFKKVSADVSALMERRRMNFMNNMLDNEYLRYLSLFWVHC